MVAAAAALLLWAVSYDARAAEVMVRNLPTVGALAVDTGGSAVTLRDRVVVEQLWPDVKEPAVGGAWHKTEARVELVAQCGGGDTDCKTLRANNTLTLVPWNGFSCDGQCPHACRANIDLEPGIFRFVVESCDGKKRYEGAPFQLTGARRAGASLP